MNQPRKFRAKPVVVETAQVEDVKAPPFLAEAEYHAEHQIVKNALRQRWEVYQQGDFPPDIFEATYEPTDR